MNFAEPLTYELPEQFFRVAEGSFDLVSEGSISQNSYFKLPRGTGLPVMRWTMDVTLATMDKDTAAAFRGWKANLGGVSACFTAFDPLLEMPRGMAAGYALSNREVKFTHPDLGTRSFARDFKILEGASTARVAENAPRYADTILIDGLPVSSMILKTGDVFGLGGNLYMANRDAWSDASGAARVSFNWKLHKGAAIGETVNFHRPRARFVLTGNDGMPLRLFSVGLGDVSIKAIEMPFFA
jgi:hypothetical protein